MIHESSAMQDHGPEDGLRPVWLRRVLDRFAEEIRCIRDLSDWRSSVLNPVLVRAIHHTDDLNERAIIRKAKMDAGITRRQMTIKDWEGFYLNLNVVQPVHQGWWLEAKPARPESPSDTQEWQEIESGEWVEYLWCQLGLTFAYLEQQGSSVTVDSGPTSLDVRGLTPYVSHTGHPVLR